MNISQIINKTQKKINNNHLEAELIVGLALNYKKEELIINYNKIIKKKDIKKINNLVNKRIKGWPIAYLLGVKNFYDLEFIINKNTLIPRPESELIIENILNEIKNNKKEEKNNKTIIDIGTGSGCLIVSLANILKNNKNIKFFGIDISSKALKIAKKNAKKYKLDKKIKFIKGDLLKPILKKINQEDELIIIANLPYLTKKEIKSSPSIKFEPQKALYGGKDGLKYYQKLLDQIKKINNDKGVSVYKEINPHQKEKLENLIIKKIGLFNPKIKTQKDLAGHYRLTITKFNFKNN